MVKRGWQGVGKAGRAGRAGKAGRAGRAGRAGKAGKARQSEQASQAKAKHIATNNKGVLASHPSRCSAHWEKPPPHMSRKKWAYHQKNQ